MRHNRFVYPSKDYKNLKNKKFFDFEKDIKVINSSDLIHLIKRIKASRVKIAGNCVEEKLFSIFIDQNIRFGPASFLTDCKNEWLAKIRHFTSRNLPLQFTILGFPFKMRVQLKTKRILPDMGEVLSLARLKCLTDLIKDNYQPGAVVTIFTEGGFGPSAGVSEKDWKAYDKRLRELTKILRIDKTIKVKELSGMERMRGFKKIFQRKVKECEEEMLSNDAVFLEKYNAVERVIFRLIDSSKYSLEVLMDVYNDSIATKDLSLVVRKARTELLNRTRKCIFYYFGYLSTRDDLDFLNKSVPNYLALSVSPKPGRLGIIPIDKKVDILPYHGVAVLDTKTRRWTLGYLIDIMRDEQNVYKPVFLKGDKDREPFYYEKRCR